LRELIESVIAIVKTDAAARLVKITTDIQASLPNGWEEPSSLRQTSRFSIKHVLSFTGATARTVDNQNRSTGNPPPIPAR
jgi:hypothetical protein